MYSNAKSGDFAPEVWGPHYWFFLESVAHTYPEYPNKLTKRKYYDLIHNLPLYIPHRKIADDFAALLDAYPVSPYLDKKDSFKRWVNFMHNRINDRLERPRVNLADAEAVYFANYRNHRRTNTRDFTVYAGGAMMIGLCIAIYLTATDE